MDIVLALILGYVVGYIHKTSRTLEKERIEALSKPEVLFSSLDSVGEEIMTRGETIKGDFVQVNQVENYLKEHKDEVVKLGDIIEEK